MALDMTSFLLGKKQGGSSASIQSSKSVEYTSNGNYSVEPDEGYDGIATTNVSVSVSPNLQNKSITINENTTTTIEKDSGYDGLGQVSITTNVQPLQFKDVNFYDYDGSLVYSYTKSEFLQLTELPANPTHDRLTAQGWNCSLSDLKTYVQKYGGYAVGQLYTTTSGNTEIDIDIISNMSKSITLNMGGTKNWGDGTTDTNTSHTYTNEGSYTIICNGNITGSGTLFGQDGTNTILANNGVKKIFLGSNVTTIPYRTFRWLYNLELATIPKSVLSIGEQVFGYNYNLCACIFPNTLTSATSINYFCSTCNTIKVISLPLNVTFNGANDSLYIGGNGLGTNLYEFYYPEKISGYIPTLVNVANVKRVVVPNTTGTHSFKWADADAFGGCNGIEELKILFNVSQMKYPNIATMRNLKLLDLSGNTQVPTFASGADFYDKVPTNLKIVVPDNLYSSWASSSAWTNYLPYIIRKSDYDNL